MRLSYILLLLVGFVVMAEAHPHVFADVSVKAVFSQDAFTGVQNRWTFDEVYSAAMLLLPMPMVMAYLQGKKLMK